MLYKLILGFVAYAYIGTYSANVLSQTGENGCYFNSCEAGEQGPLILEDKFCADIQIAILEANNNFTGLYSESRKYTTEEFTGEKLEWKKGLGIIQRGFLEANYCNVGANLIQCHYSKSYDPASSNQLIENINYGQKMTKTVNDCLLQLGASRSALKNTSNPYSDDAFDNYVCLPDGIKIRYLVYGSEPFLGFYNNHPDCANSNPFN